MNKKERKATQYCAICLKELKNRNILNGDVWQETGIHLFYCSVKCLEEAKRLSLSTPKKNWPYEVKNFLEK